MVQICFTVDCFFLQIARPLMNSEPCAYRKVWGWHRGKVPCWLEDQQQWDCIVVAAGHDALPMSRCWFFVLAWEVYCSRRITWSCPSVLGLIDQQVGDSKWWCDARQQFWSNIIGFREEEVCEEIVKEDKVTVLSMVFPRGVRSPHTQVVLISFLGFPLTITEVRDWR